MMSDNNARVDVDARLGAMVRSSSGLPNTGTVVSGLVDNIQTPGSFAARLTSSKASEGNDTLLEAITRLIQPIEANILFPFKIWLKAPPDM